MCLHCKKLNQKIRHLPPARCQACEGEELDRCIQELFDRVFRLLEEATGGSVQQDLDRATGNLIKMYELDAPEFLIRKAHAVQRRRLRSFRGWARNDRKSAMRTGSEERRRKFILVQGGKL
jgi:hypothetical protein